MPGQTLSLFTKTHAIAGFLCGAGGRKLNSTTTVPKMQLQRGGPERECFMYTYEYVRDGEEERGGLQGAGGGLLRLLKRAGSALGTVGLFAGRI